MRVGRSWGAALGLCIILSTACVAGAAAAPERVIARIDLSKPFHLPPGATFTATQGPPLTDPLYEGEGPEPGKIHLCVQVAARAPCAPELDTLATDPGDKFFSDIHFLHTVEIVHPRGATGEPLLHLQFGSLLSGDGDEAIAGDILAYRPGERRFETIFHEPLGHNNNQEARYIASGPLKGAMVVVHPTGNAPFGYRVTVHRLTPDYRYKQVLRYRSATHYNDGNSLAVIDSEMPNILHRLGLWSPRQPLPLPRGHCPHPHLVETELWCS